MIGILPMLLEILLGVIGAVLTIIMSVYVPRLLNAVNSLTKEFHQMNVLTEKRLTALETMMAVQMKTRNHR